ncbi:hypothetical protein K443DRAFT_64405, partial [Laccaria amethystina LaAM-08-1]
MTSKFPKVVGYELVQQIGGGGFSTVYRAVNFEDHRVAACKLVLLTPSTSEKERKNIEKEMRVHAALKHTNVLEFLNAVVVEPKHRGIYVPGIYMLLELAAGGDLFDKIAPDVGVGDQVAHYYFNQLLAGMEYIDSQGVCHRDLKSENLLLDVAGTLKISDFGLSAVYKLKESGKTRTLTERCGSLPSAAPEVCTFSFFFSFAFCFFVCPFVSCFLLLPHCFFSAFAFAVDALWLLSFFCVLHLFFFLLTEETALLRKNLLAVDPSKRISLAEAASHSWCLRLIQLTNRGPLALADKLTESLRDNGDLRLAAPDFGSRCVSFFLSSHFRISLPFFVFLIDVLRPFIPSGTLRCLGQHLYGLSI